MSPAHSVAGSVRPAASHGIVSHGQHGVREEDRPRTTRSTRNQRILLIHVARAFRGWIRAPGSEPRNSQPRTTRSARRRQATDNTEYTESKDFTDPCRPRILRLGPCARPPAAETG